MTTNWHEYWQRYVYEEEKQIPMADYLKQKRFESLSPHAHQLFIWLKNRQKRSYAISLRELTKCTVPPALRKAAGIKEIMQELVTFGFAEIYTDHIRYAGHLCCMCWKVIHLESVNTE